MTPAISGDKNTFPPHVMWTLSVHHTRITCHDLKYNRVFLVPGQAGQAGGQTVQPEGPGESHALRLDTGEKTGVFCLGSQGMCSILKTLTDCQDHFLCTSNHSLSTAYECYSLPRCLNHLCFEGCAWAKRIKWDYRGPA